jgi:cytochrome c peroxidase
MLALACAFGAAAAAPDGFRSNPLTTADASGWLRTFTPAGTIDTGNPFFQSLGTNGRSCNSCHRQAEGWTVTPAELQQRFDATQGLDPIFRTNDGSVSPFADVSTPTARRLAYAMLLNRGLIRVGLPIPANAEFSLTAVDDPYHYASAAELSLFRRPLPATNLGFLTTVMWDGRETAAPFKPPMDAGVDSADLEASLASQAKDAVLGHAQGAAAPSDDVLAQIVAFESGLSTAQIRDDNAGLLNDDDAIGGPRVLANLRFHVGINDALGADPTGAAFDPSAMHLFDAWATQRGNGRTGRARAAIQRGEALFNTFPITITGVAGLNDVTGQPSIAGHCSTCHDTPNVGNHSVAAPLNIGLTDASRRTPDMPLYTLTNNQTGVSVQTTDPGRALLTGKWADIGKFKGATLRGLAARAPYFHNGSAATLMDVVNFYDARFTLNLSAQQKQDLVAFLAAL